MADHAASASRTPRIRAEIAGNRLELIESGVERFNMLLELIAGAESSIKMLMYMFNPDRDGDAVRNALTDAARRGVQVKLLIDGFGSAATPDFFTELGKAGGEHCVFNPSWGRRYLLRNHQKLIVVDDRTVLIGGANIDATYLEDRGSKHWRDLWLRIDGPEAALPSRYFDSLFRWSRRSKSKLRSLRRMLAEYNEWRGPLQW
ncbi:MAG TPA: phospholipase D-like domain-containing protein [Sphingomicrobium sp.]|nr:phospholipase D-like domain-containing protein [Sphingomicrobium sp.]